MSERWWLLGIVLAQATRQDLERLTGGIVIWNQGAKVLLYKGPEAEKRRKEMKDLTWVSIGRNLEAKGLIPPSSLTRRSDPEDEEDEPDSQEAKE